jgi:hypothetical protein
MTLVGIWVVALILAGVLGWAILRSKAPAQQMK